MSQENKECCANCRYFKPTSLEIDKGTCHLNPPAAIPVNTAQGLNIMSAFTPVQTNGWCGQHEAKTLGVQQ